MKRNALFEECLANVSPDVKAEVERDIDKILKRNMKKVTFSKQIWHLRFFVLPTFEIWHGRNFAITFYFLNFELQIIIHRHLK